MWKFYTALYWPEVWHHIRFHTMVKLSWQRVWWNNFLPEFGLWEMQKGIFFFFVNNLVTNEKKEWPTKKFDRSKVWLWEFRLSEEILLGINILILIRGWTGLWSKQELTSVQWFTDDSQRGKKHLSEQTDRWITWSRWQAVNEGFRWECRWWVSGSGGRGHGGRHSD